jgi:hypothetical protein
MVIGELDSVKLIFGHLIIYKKAFRCSSQLEKIILLERITWILGVRNLHFPCPEGVHDQNVAKQKWDTNARL